MEGWLAGTSVVTGSAAYEGGGGGGPGRHQRCSLRVQVGRQAGGGLLAGGWVGAKLPGAELPPSYTRSLQGSRGCHQGLAFVCADGSASSHVSTVPRMLSEEKYTCSGRCR